jgi:hypothetical protein
VVARCNVAILSRPLATRLRSRMAFLRELTPLHLFVVTLRCEHSYFNAGAPGIFSRSKMVAVRATNEKITPSITTLLGRDG